MKEQVVIRDEKAIAKLAKEQKQFDITMLDVDLQNFKNKNYVNLLLNKYLKKFDLEDEEVCKTIFVVACEAGNKKAVATLIKQKKAVKKYSYIACASDEFFGLLKNIKPDELENDYVVDFIVNAALSENAAQRLKALKANGFNLDMKTAKEETAEQILEEIIHSAAYSKNKSGSLKRQQDKDALQYLRRLKSGQIPEDKKPFPWNIVAPIAVAVVILGAVAAGFLLNPPAEEVPLDNAGANAETAVDYNKDTSLVVADGDTVNIDYVGSVDGVEFAGGNTNGAGTQLTIGSNSYIDDFEQQLIGHNVGEEVEVNVTFPENYGNEELNGKDAVFKVVINGIYDK